MASLITELDQFDATITRPDDGDASNAASISGPGVGLQPLANRTNYLRNRVLPTVGLRHNLVMNQPAHDGVANGWVFNTTDNTWDDSNGGELAVWSVQFPHVPVSGSVGWQIDAIEVWVFNPNLHVGLPAVAQKAELHYVEPQTAAAKTLVVSFADGAAFPVLDTLHSFSTSGVGHTLLNGAQYWLEFTGESGANAQPDVQIHAIYFDLIPV